MSVIEFKPKKLYRLPSRSDNSIIPADHQDEETMNAFLQGEMVPYYFDMEDPWNLSKAYYYDDEASPYNGMPVFQITINGLRFTYPFDCDVMIPVGLREYIKKQKAEARTVRVKSDAMRWFKATNHVFHRL